ncbi:hypothetical protein SLS61_001631 [Didymella pomorum]
MLTIIQAPVPLQASLSYPLKHLRHYWSPQAPLGNMDTLEGTTRGGPQGGLLEKCNVYDGPGYGAKRIPVKQAEEMLDVTTVPDDLLRMDPDTGADVFDLKTEGRDEWVERFGKAKHHGFMTYGGTVVVYQYGGGHWLL